MYMLDSNSPINIMCLEAFARRVRGKKTERIMDAGLFKGEFESKFLILISLLHYSLILSSMHVGSYLIMFLVYTCIEWRNNFNCISACFFYCVIHRTSKIMNLKNYLSFVYYTHKFLYRVYSIVQIMYNWSATMHLLCACN